MTPNTRVTEGRREEEPLTLLQCHWSIGEPYSDPSIESELSRVDGSTALTCSVTMIYPVLYPVLLLWIPFKASNAQIKSKSHTNTFYATKLSNGCGSNKKIKKQNM